MTDPTVIARVDFNFRQNGLLVAGFEDIAQGSPNDLAEHQMVRVRDEIEGLAAVAVVRRIDWAKRLVFLDTPAGIYPNPDTTEEP